MLRDIRGWLNVHDVARSMGLDLTNDQAWRAGQAMEKQWKWAVGAPPVKDNRRKKIGRGSHCFALYPPTDEWRERIVRKITDVRATTLRQMDMFA